MRRLSLFACQAGGEFYSGTTVNKFKNRYILQLLISLAFGFLCAFAEVWAVENEPASVPEETMLMFVGEETKVLGIASRREQSAWQAPAIARVLTRSDLTNQGAYTLKDALKDAPGFYMAQKEWGTQSYLRGISNSTLFLYDTVPVGSEVNKSIHHLDNDLPLWHVKRVEIINGPASVLWGPDAFAGIVNVVPMTGKDLKGVETGVIYQEPGNHVGAFCNAGHDGGLWDAFLSISARRGEEDDRAFHIVRFRGDDQLPVPPEDRLGKGYPGKSEYLEAYGHASYDDWFNLSGRLSYNEKPYTMTSDEGNTSWGESRKSPFGFIKLEMKKDLDLCSAIKFMGFYSRLRYDHEVIDSDTSQKENTVYGEMIYDRSMFSGTGIFTGGVSYRDKRVHDAPVWKGYLPGYLESDNTLFFPIVLSESYDSGLWSVFGQFTKTIGHVDFFAGARHDMHDDFDDQTSLSLGFGWSPSPSWRCKLLGGTAYRTPFARQLYEGKNPDLEEIRSLNLQIAWEKPSRMGFSATGFYQWLDNHVVEDPYAGLSFPNDQEIYGMEIEGHCFLHNTLKIRMNLTIVQNSGSDEQYQYLESITIDEEGNIIRNYAVNSYPYDPGADRLFNAQITWQPSKNLSLYARAGYISSRSLLFPRDDAFKVDSVSSTWQVDATAVIRDIFSGADLELSVRNLTDSDYETPGTYDLIDGDPITGQAVLRFKW